MRRMDEDASILFEKRISSFVGNDILSFLVHVFGRKDHGTATHSNQVHIGMPPRVR